MTIMTYWNLITRIALDDTYFMLSITGSGKALTTVDVDGISCYAVNIDHNNQVHFRPTINMAKLDQHDKCAAH